MLGPGKDPDLDQELDNKQPSNYKLDTLLQEKFQFPDSEKKNQTKTSTMSSPKTGQREIVGYKKDWNQKC